MRVTQQQRQTDGRWLLTRTSPPGNAPDLALAFGSTALLSDVRVRRELVERAQGANIVGASTAGEIHDTHVDDQTVSLTTISFDESNAVVHCLPHREGTDDSGSCGRALATGLDPNGLRHVFVLFEGLAVNGSVLVAGLRSVIPPHVPITGGLAGDGSRFQQTLVIGGREANATRGVAVGFYGERLHTGCGSLGGWDVFGPERLVTRSVKNVLYEMDGKPALETYKRYLGAQAQQLPASALLFPLSVRARDGTPALTRTILSCNEEEGSMTFAGDVPEGSLAQLMRANTNRLIAGAEGAAKASTPGSWPKGPELAMLISCVGRRLVLKQRAEEEVESVRAVLGELTALTGFYSYGEISPFAAGARCELHNQTMTITTLSEACDAATTP